MSDIPTAPSAPDEPTHASAAAGVTGRTIFRVGLALVLLSLVLLLRYSIEQGWFGPTARITLGGLASGGLVVAGLLVSRRPFGRLLEGAGVAGGYATVWAAHSRYVLVSDDVAFIQLTVVTVVGVVLALREQSDGLAALALAGGALAPTLVGRSELNPILVAVSLAVVLGAASALYSRFSWQATFAAVAVSSVPLLWSDHPIWPAVVVVWWLAVWALPNMGHLAGLAPAPTPAVTAATLPASVMALAVISAIYTHDAATALTAAVLAAAHGLARRLSPEGSKAEVHLFAAFAFAALAVSALFSGAVGVAALLVVATGLCVVGSRSDHESAQLVGMLAAAYVGLLWLVAVAESPHRLGADAVAAAASPAVLAAGAGAARRTMRKILAAAAYGMSSVWVLYFLGGVDPALATAGLAALALAAIIFGHLRPHRPSVVVGLVMLALTLVKLFFVDLVAADPLLKIGLAFGLGVALLGVGYWVGDSLLGARTKDPSPSSAPQEPSDDEVSVS